MSASLQESLELFRLREVSSRPGRRCAPPLTSKWRPRRPVSSNNGTLSVLFEGLSTLVLAATPCFAQAPPEDPLYDEVEKLGWDLTEKHRVPGVAIARIHEGKLAWTLGCGYADLEAETPVTGETVFNIGSISKTVAAWGAMKLVESGQVDLDAPVEQYLTRWKLPQSEFDARGVTLRRLLSHTAGLSLHGYPGWSPEAKLPTIEESLSGNTNGAGDVRIEHQPGSKWQYSGGGYTLAQLMIEEVTGRGFAEYMKAEVLEPLGMKSSDYRWTDEIDRLAATPYDRSGEPIGGPRFTEAAAAGLQTSAADLARFGIASMPRFWPSDSPRVLSAKTVELMQTPAPASPDYGLGYELRRDENLLLVGHGGANDGWMARLTLAPEIGDGLVILTNGTNGIRLHDPIEKAWLASLRAPAAR